MTSRSREPLISVRRRLRYSLIGLGLMLFDMVVLEERAFLFWTGAGFGIGVAVFDLLSQAGRWRIALCSRAWIGAYALLVVAPLFRAWRLVALAAGALIVLANFRFEIERPTEPAGQGQG